MPKTKKLSGCTWCCGSDHAGLNLGAGLFRDVDSDFSYGIPVCGGCGGLGFTIPGKKFRKSTETIMNLRFAFCPPSTEVPLPNVLRLQRLQALITAVKEHYEKFGESRQGCCAERIANGALIEREQELIDAVQEEIRFFTDAPPRQDAGMEETRRVFLLALNGNIEQAAVEFAGIVKKYPDDGCLAHDFAVFLSNYSRDFPQALVWFEKATQLKPQKALHFVQYAKACLNSKQFDQAKQAVESATACADCDAETARELRQYLQ